MSGSGGRSSRDNVTKKSSLTFATPLTSSPSSSGLQERRGSLLAQNKSMSQLDPNRRVPQEQEEQHDDEDDGCNSCSGYLDDSKNNNMLKFVTSSKMLDFLFERDNLCNKSEECLQQERDAEEEEGGGWGLGNFAVDAVGSAVSLAMDFLLGGEDKKSKRGRGRGCEESDDDEQSSNGHCSDQQSDDESVNYVPQRKRHPQKKCTKNKNASGPNPNISTVRIVHENGESITKSQADIIRDHTMTHAELLERLEKISNLCNMLSDDNNYSMGGDSAIPGQGRSRSVHQLGQNCSSDANEPPPTRRKSSCRKLGPTPSQVGVDGSSTLMQGLLKPFCQTSVIQVDPLIGDLETGILPELVPSNDVNCPSSSQNLPSTSAQASGPPVEHEVCPDEEVQVTPPPKDNKCIEATPPSSNVGTQQNGPEMINTGGQNDPPETEATTPLPPPPQDNKSTNTTPPNDVATQQSGPDSTTNPDANVTPKVHHHPTALKYVITEVTRATTGETETTLEVDGQTIQVPTNQDSKGAWINELQKLNTTGSVLKSNLQDIKNIGEKSTELGHNSNRMKDLVQKTTPESVTSINITVEEDFPENENDGEGSGKKTITKNMECKLHDFHPVDSQQTIKGVEVGGKILDPDEEPELELYIKRLEEIEATLEEIAVDFKDMMKSSTENLSDNNAKKKEQQDSPQVNKDGKESSGSANK